MIMFMLFVEMIPSIFITLIMIRYLTDILDGAVARRYNKGTVVGGYLDSLCDIMLISVFAVYYVSYITSNIFVLLCVSYTTIISLIVYFYIKNSLYDHVGLKVNPTNDLEKVIQWFVNNTLFIYAIQVAFILTIHLL